MKNEVLAWIACPLCRGPLRIEDGTSGSLEDGALACVQGHRFPVVRGVPRLLPTQRMKAGQAGRSIQESFSREWSHFDYGTDRTWGQTVDERREDFLRHLDVTSDAVAGKVVLDAGCGNGALSVAISSFGCDVVATDISSSVEAAARRFAQLSDRTHFIQSDLMNPALKPGAFDIVYCAGVLHHTPNTRTTFESLVPALAPGGLMFVWLYWREPGLRALLSEGLRRVLSPMPAPIKHGVVSLLVPQSLIRNRIRAARKGDTKLNAREIRVRMLDSYTPRYRWVHRPEEVGEWFGSLGFTDIKVTERGTHGFGITARGPASGTPHRETALEDVRA